VLNPSHLPVIYATDNKTDKEDALKLAHLLTGRPDSRLPLVPVPDDREMRRREILGSYRREKRSRNRNINRLHALFVHQGIVTVVRKDPATEESRRETVNALSGLVPEKRKSIYACGANRAEAKAIYNLPGNDKFNKSEILRAHSSATIRRTGGHPLILAARDTTSVNYDGQQKMKGNGYIGDKTMGGNIHSALAVTSEGLVPGVPGRTGFNRAKRKNTVLTVERKKNRPIEEKESKRWPGTTGNADLDIGDDIKILHVCDREGDNYELFDKALQSGRHFLIRIINNRMTVENEQILDTIRETPGKGRVKALIPRDSRRNVKEREAVLQVRYARYEIKSRK
jgi:hypothetical protein